MTPDEEQFLKDHRLCVVSTVRKDGAPQSTPVYYIYEDGKLLISVTKSRKKTLNVGRDARVSVAVLAEEPPFKHVQVQGTAVIRYDDLVETSRRIWSTFRDELPQDFAQVLQDQGRTLMVVTPSTVTSNLVARR
ncbi:MAG: PPOX class F420-dependent oxidoreductase [Chloroflexi bacterium]|nr:PPOX class F420-dependent oxidoreductase [Chloroflexota bacterium]